MPTIRNLRKMPRQAAAKSLKSSARTEKEQAKPVEPKTETAPEGRSRLRHNRSPGKACPAT